MDDAMQQEPRPDGTPENEQIQPDTEGLRDYARAKHALAQVVRSIRGLASELKDDRIASEGQELMTKLAEDRFTLAVVGQFKRGKSSLMNAIIGRELLPTGVLPVTSAITVLKYGPAEKLTIQREGSIFSEEPPVTALADYVTEEGNPGNRRKVKAAVLEEPIAFLRRGLEFVDTPGIGSAIQANTETTYAFLPQCDAVVFVTGLDSPLTEAELDFLRCTRQFAQRMFFVVNKVDLLEEAEREKTLSFISDRLRLEMQDESIKLFPLSSRIAMTAKGNNDSAAYAWSGLNSLEEALGAFLSRQRAEAFLASILSKAVRLIEGLNCGVSTDTAANCQRIRDRLEAIHETLFPGTAPAREATSEAPDTSVGEHPIDQPAIQWPQALQTRGCPVCAHMADAAFKLYAQWQYSIATDEASQDRFAAEMGFCPLHTWQFLAVSSPQGTSAGYAGLIEKCAKRLSELSAIPETAAESLANLLPASQRCSACRTIRAVEADTIDSLAAFLAAPGGLRAYRGSQGVCVRHVGLLAAAAHSADLVRQVLQHAAGRFDEAAEDMQNYAMKHEGIRRWLQNKDERDAYLRAIVHLVGEKAACGLWQDDAEI